MRGPEVSVVRFTCYRCVHCCFFTEERECPVLLWYEVPYFRKLGEFVGVELRLKEVGQGFYRVIVSGFCPFYDVASRACRIHEEKPLSCRMFPLIVNLSSLEVASSLMCPWVYANKGVLGELGGESLEQAFPEEFKALREVVRVYLVSKSAPKLAVYFTTYFKELASEVIRSISERYDVIKVSESSVVEGFYYLLIEGEVDTDYLDKLLKRDEITWYKLERVPPIS